MNRYHALLGAIALQMAVLTWEFASSRLPLVDGTRVQLRVVPVDPRSWFSGNYAALSYEIASVEAKLVDRDIQSLERGKRVFVSLRQEGDVWGVEKVSAGQPESGVFLRGKVEGYWNRPPEVEDSIGEKFEAYPLRLSYGPIEAWYAPKDKAIALENEIRDTPSGTVRVEVAITSSGRAAIAHVIR
jgi:uncharacterized membrane-anchored protein